MPNGYVLADGVHACQIGQAWVLLAIQEDRYFCLAGRQAAWFGQLTGDDASRPLCAGAACFADRLCARGILAPAPGPRAMASALLPAAREGAAPRAPGVPAMPPRLSDALGMARAMLVLGHLQDPGRRKLARVLSSVKAWKQDAAAIREARAEDAVSRAQAFQALTPWFFTSRDACFFGSLLLVHFLARSGMAADWTFGVRLSPFRAHCWVSAGNILLNEDPDVAADYQPILTI